MKKPLQPIILILTLTLSISVFLTSLTVESALEEETTLTQYAKYGSADLTVTLNGNSKSRFMFEEKANEILKGKAKAAGAYELPLFFGEEREAALGVAISLSEIGNIFSFDFIDYGSITKSTVSEAAIISKAFAREQDLAVGDTFRTEVLGEKKLYTVSGITASPILASYDVMLDITGVMRALAGDSLLVSALGEDFKPCSTIYVDLYDGESAEECVNLLRADRAFSEKTFTVVSDIVKVKSGIESLTVIIDIMILLVSVLTAAVTFCCFYILSHERSEENYTFALAGAKPCLLNLMQYLEVVIYWFIAAALGILISIPLTNPIMSYIGFYYAEGAFSPINIIKSSVILLIVSLMTVTVFIIMQKFRQKPKKRLQLKSVSIIILTAVELLLIILVFTLPVRLRFLLGLVCMTMLFIWVFFTSDFLLRSFVGFINKRIDKRFTTDFKTKFPALRYAVKNLYSVKILHNFSRLIALLTAIMMTFVPVIISAHGFINIASNIFDGEYAVINATESCYNKLLESEKAERVDKIYIGTGIQQDGTSTNILSASGAEAFSEMLNISTLPAGNSAVISTGCAEQLSLNIEDEFYVEINNKRIDLVVADIVKSGINIVCFDCEEFEIPYNIITVTVKDGIPKEELLRELTDKTALELAAIMQTKDLLKEKLQTADIYLNAGNLLLLVTLVFSIAGLIDNLYQSYKSRKAEFVLYECSGMSKKDIRRMKLFEIAAALIFGIVFGFIAFVIGAFITDHTLSALGYETFINISKL